MSAGCLDNYKRILDEVRETAVKAGRNPDEVLLLPVSKTQSVEKMLELCCGGVTMFGESKVQEALPKIKTLADACCNGVFHFIGRLQTNKSGKIVENFSLIHSVDRLDALNSVSLAACKGNKIQKILLQINLAGETQKGGVGVNDIDQLVQKAFNTPNIHMDGFMMMPPFDEGEQNRKYFKVAREIFEKYHKISPSIKTLSMGMSGDYRVAVEEGATILRIGSSIFGNR